MQKPHEHKGTGLSNEGSVASRARNLWSLGLFFCLSAVFSWTVWLWPIRKHGAFAFSAFGWDFKLPFLLTKLLIGNCLPGILAVVWVLFEGHGQFRQMLTVLTRWKTPLKWYVVAFILPCGISFVALDVALLFFPVEHSFPPATEFLESILLSLPFGPFWEELAWRAFALRKLESQYSRLSSALLLGAYWALWHIPLWLVQQESTAFSKSLFLLSAIFTLIAWSVIWAYLYHRSAESL